MKRILIVAPVASEMHLPIERAVAMRAVGPDTEVVVRHIEGVPESVWATRPEICVPHLVEAVAQGQADGFEAIGISCCLDLGLRECRAAVDVPVSAPFEAIAKLLPAIGRIAVLYPDVPDGENEAEPEGEDWIPELLERYACGDCVISHVPVAIERPAIEFSTPGATPAAVGQALIEAMVTSIDGGGTMLARAAMGEGATGVFAACTYWAGTLDGLRDRLPIRVLDPIEELARYLELLAATRPAARGAGIAFAHATPRVPLIDGSSTRFVNFDSAASTPPLAAVARAVTNAMGTYASIHRGPSHLSRISTFAYENARATVAESTGARPDQVVVFTRSTTDAFTLLASAVPGRVLHLDIEHHANLLPWRRGVFTTVAAADTVAGSLEALESELKRAPAALVSVAGASNVTGECLPLHDLAALAHRYGARLAVDGAQLAPHRQVDIEGTGIDYFACSGHKLYAPYGTGVLIGYPDWLDAADPYQPGGGAVEAVTLDGARWKQSPDRHEGGTPNLAGAVAIGAAFHALREIGFDAIIEHELTLYTRLLAGLAAMGIEPLRIWPEHQQRVGVATFNVPGYHAGLVSAYLSAEHGVGVRSGKFCAHPLLSRFGLEDAGGVRASIGLGTRTGDVDVLLTALESLIAHGPRSDYKMVDGYMTPIPLPERANESGSVRVEADSAEGAV